MRFLPSLLAAVLLLQGLPPLARAEPTSAPLEKRVFKGAGGKTLPYRLLLPGKQDPGTRYPLVLFLHGAGERGTDNEGQLRHGVPAFASAAGQEKYPCILVAPQCPTGARWVEVDWGAASHQQPEQPSAPMALTLELLDALCKELPVDRSRVYVTGLSMGGYGTWDILARRPEMFAAAAPVCGGADEATAGRIAHIPVWVFHGAKDGVVKTSRSRNMIQALQKAGARPKYTEYPDVGHAAWGPAYKDPELFRWLFAQKRR